MFDWYTWVGLPALVFFACVVDVTLGTLRIIFTSRGKKVLAPLLGFVEVFIWVSIIAQISRRADNIAAYFAYAAGFAAGNYIGMLVVRAIIPGSALELIKALVAKGYAICPAVPIPSETAKASIASPIEINVIVNTSILSPVCELR